MNNRGEIKWAPFNSLISNRAVIKEIIKEKEKIKKPVISDDDLEKLEQKIIDAYYEEISVSITYYKAGNIRVVKGKIKKIDKVTKLIYLDDIKIFFKSILEVNDTY